MLFFSQPIICRLQQVYLEQCTPTRQQDDISNLLFVCPCSTRDCVLYWCISCLVPREYDIRKKWNERNYGCSPTRDVHEMICIHNTSQSSKTNEKNDNLRILQNACEYFSYAVCFLNGAYYVPVGVLRVNLTSVIIFRMSLVCLLPCQYIIITKLDEHFLFTASIQHKYCIMDIFIWQLRHL